MAIHVAAASVLRAFGLKLDDLHLFKTNIKTKVKQNTFGKVARMIKDPALGIGRIEPFGFVHLALLTPVACFRVFLRIPRKTGAIYCSAWTSRLILVIVVIWRLLARARFAPVEISVTGAALLPTGLGSVPAARVA